MSHYLHFACKFILVNACGSSSFLSNLSLQSSPCSHHLVPTLHPYPRCMSLLAARNLIIRNSSSMLCGNRRLNRAGSLIEALKYPFV
ncbi:hypothetical protein LINPERPRIM_LOCUS13175 [Linum perenne]